MARRIKMTYLSGLTAVVTVLLLASIANAQQPSAAQQFDQYWQQFYAQSQAQCGQSIVSLAKQLDDAKKQISDLQKGLEQSKQSSPH